MTPPPSPIDGCLFLILVVHLTYLEDDDPQLPVPQRVCDEEPRREAGEDDADDGDGIGGEGGRHARVGHGPEGGGGVDVVDRRALKARKTLLRYRMFR